jgi:hypothetical protein
VSEDKTDDFQRAADPARCARCARSPRSVEDRAAWATIDDAEVCPGCLTLADSEQIRNENR